MKITIALDSLKGSLTSLEAGYAVEEGIRAMMSDVETHVRPLADGGEGTLEALALGLGGKVEIIGVTGPLGGCVRCRYGVIKKTRTAIIEMSEAAGLTLISPGERNPLRTTTYGVGEVLRAAIADGYRNFIVGIGGSATNDGGIGMLQALGYGFWDVEGNAVPFGAQGLERLAKINDSNVMPELSECTFKVACDVTNPLCGELGCSAVFGPQKGATPEMVLQMDRWMVKYAALSKAYNPAADPQYAGAGAAGGLGFAFLTYTNAVLDSGVKIVLEETNLETYIKDSDIVITGEGRLDGQTAMGKAPVGVAALAKKYKKPVIAFCGSAGKDAGVCNSAGIDAYFPILQRVETLEAVMKKETAMENMRRTAEQVFRLIRAMA